MSLPNLIELLPQPKNDFVKSITNEEWQDVEFRIATELPADYKSFVSKYGACYLGLYIFVYSPFYEDPSFNLLQRQAEFYKIMVGEREEFPEYYGKFRFFPEPEGLLLWGRAESGLLLWRTQGKPDDWKVTILEKRGFDYEEYDMNSSSFLYQYLIGSLPNSEILIPPTTDNDKLFFHLEELPLRSS